MSIDSKKICCTECDFETQELYRPILIVYRLSNGVEVKAGYTKGWCFDCRDYVNIEDMNLHRLQERLVAKEQERRGKQIRTSELSSVFLAGLRNQSELRNLRYSITRLDEEVRELGSLLAIAENRISKSRCLTCWAGNTTPVTFDSKSNLSRDFRHECGGYLRFINEESGMRFNFAITTYVLNEEGLLLEEQSS
jgi:hypothetical protein